MANLELKKEILEVVNNQLRDNVPPAAGEAYRKLTEAGYSASEAKDRIGSVVVTEIYNILKKGNRFDDQKYQSALESMVAEALLLKEKSDGVLTDWEKWDNLVQAGYDAQYRAQSEDPEENESEMLKCWWSAWDIFRQIIAAEEQKKSVSWIMEEQDYRYPVDAWLQDMEMELGNAGENEKQIEFCREVLDILDWKYEDGSNFMSALGESLYRTGKIDEGKQWFRDCLKKEGDNQNILIAYCWCLAETEGLEIAYDLIRRKVIGIPCGTENQLLFSVAKTLANALHQEDDLKWIKQQMEIFEASWRAAVEHNDLHDDFSVPIMKPIVKEKKIYPNDPCPCGGGKKYKKCCGRK